MKKAAVEPREGGRRNRHGKSVYLSPEIEGSLGGSGSRVFQDACWCWARHLERCTLQVADEFDDGEWRLLALATQGAEASFDPALDEPGALLALWVDRAARSIPLGDGLLRSAGHLASILDRLRRLSWSQAWAVIWSLRYRASHNIHLDEVKWWTLAHRAQRAFSS